MQGDQLALVIGFAVIGGLLLLAMSQRAGVLSPEAAARAAYTNREEWELVRDPAGRLSKIVVHRRAGYG